MKKAKLIALFLLCALVFQPILHAVWLWAILFDDDRAWKMFVSFDKFGNGGFNGNPNETLSERAAKGMVAGSHKWCLLCKLLHFFDRNHCEKVLAGNTPRWDTVPSNPPKD